ncbi:hypothetical protein LTR37_002518 [Vermiconidia calcicola]|uniref:Uncharacterized protein n=1 Tax=Vermiconidia calcicola TaxID=1690605 RepID=A0ACC3NU93_9PEZI|nr:hypothetical protein LTR37_002518 [Vermiconidia calcicola]
MPAALKLATLASGLTLFSASAAYALKTPQQDFSKNALALEHTLDVSSNVLPKPKLPSNFLSFTIGGYEFKNAA